MADFAELVRDWWAAPSGRRSAMLKRGFSFPNEATAIDALRELAERYASTVINTPHTDDFVNAVAAEAVHQRERFGVESDAGKTPADWFWLIGYLAGKALHAAAAGNQEKALHHTISTAAALLNWHAHMTGASTVMRPGTGA